MNIKRKRALRQLREIEKLAEMKRLAADGWDEDWKTLIATLMSARTTDKITIPIAERLFDRYDSIKSLSAANVRDVGDIIRGVNFYKTKSNNIVELCKILVKNYNCKVPHDFFKLIELPGVGRKTANVFLAEKGHDAVGVDTHLTYCSRRLGWTKNANPDKIEEDLKKLFPRKYWKNLNWVIVRFGQTYRSRRIKNQILDKIKKFNNLSFP